MSAQAILPRPVPSVASVRCNYCSKFFPHFLVHQITRAQTICENCLDWHNKAIEFLATGFPPGCQGCGASSDFLRDSILDVELRMYVVPKDGIYQVLCATCIVPYLPKRADLYGGTEFGNKSLKL